MFKKNRILNEIKSDWGRESYLSLKDGKLTSLFARFRCNTIGLNGELKVRNRRSCGDCRLCGHSIEDVEHFIAYCPFFDDLRKIWRSEVDCDLMGEDMVKAVLRSEKDVVKGRAPDRVSNQVMSSMNFLCSAWNIRKEKLFGSLITGINGQNGTKI